MFNCQCRDISDTVDVKRMKQVMEIFKIQKYTLSNSLVLRIGHSGAHRQYVMMAI